MKLDKYAQPDEEIKRIFSEMGGNDFDRMRTYLFELDRSMRNQKMLLIQSHKAELEMFPNATKMTNSVYETQHENYDTHFKGILLNSALITSYSLFESIFKEVCLYAAKMRNIEIKKDHFSTRNITGGYKKFIETEIGIDLSEIEEYWNQLVLSQRLRNKIVHQSATIPESDQLTEYVITNQYIDSKSINEKVTFFIKDRLYLFDYLVISSSYLLWILMRIEPINPVSEI